MRPTDALEHPPDWSEMPVRKAVEIRRGLSWSKDQERSTPNDDTVPVLRITNVKEELDLSDVLYLTGVPQKARDKKRATKDWSIVVGSNGNRERIGNAVRILEDSDFLFASFLLAAKPREDVGISPEFFYRWLTSHPVQSRLSATAEGSTGLSNLAHDFFKAMEVAYPDDEEQVAVANILDAVDVVIKRTRTMLEKARTVKRGLMQRLFTEGVNHTQFISTEVGRIPATWEAVKGKKLFKTLGGFAPSAIRFAREHETPDAWFMKVDDFNDPINSRSIIRTKLGFRMSDNQKVSVLPIGTIVIAKRGAAIEKNRVRATAVPTTLDPNLMGLSLSEGVYPEFFRYQLEWRKLSRYIESSGVPQLNNKDLYPRLFLRPQKDEQLEIIKILKASEDIEDRIHDELSTLETMKRGLMQDLLTGKVRAKQLAIAGSATD